METWNNEKKELPNATTVLTLGILSLVLFWLYGLVSLILGIIAWIMGNNERRIYLESPGVYSEASLRNVRTGRTCAIIAVCLATFTILFVILLFMGLIVGVGAGIFSSVL